MNSNSEIPQQINEVEDAPSSDQAGSSLNGSGTESKSGTPLTRDRSRFGLAGLRGLRDKYGPKSAIGHRCSNIEELLNQPKPPVALIQRQTADLKRLLAAGG